jgi:hypothetical protein
MHTVYSEIILRQDDAPFGQELLDVPITQA